MMKLRNPAQPCCHTALLAIATLTRALAEPCRDRFLQPFSSQSIWNTPIGSGAAFVPAGLFDGVFGNSTCGREPCGPPLSFHNDQDFIVRTTQRDPLTDWVDQGNWNGSQNKCAVVGKVVRQLPLPFNWTSASDGGRSAANQMNNNAMGVLLPDNRTLVQMQPAYRCSAGGPLLAVFGNQSDGCPQQFPNVTDILGEGAAGSHGGSGLSGVGGSVRLGELLPHTGPIQHALKVTDLLLCVKSHPAIVPKVELQSRWYFGGWALQNATAANGGRVQYLWPARGSDGGTNTCRASGRARSQGNCTYTGNRT